LLHKISWAKLFSAKNASYPFICMSKKKKMKGRKWEQIETAIEYAPIVLLQTNVCPSRKNGALLLIPKSWCFPLN